MRFLTLLIRPALAKSNLHWFLVRLQHTHRKTRLQSLLSEMSLKSRETKVVLRHVKRKEKYHGQLPPPSTIDVRVVGSGGKGSPAAVLISTDNCKYLFNCGEGTQRITSEHRMRITKLENIFVTHKSWLRMGGLLGMALTLEAIFVPAVTIHGPPGVENIIGMAKGFAESSNIKIEKRDLKEGFFEDTAFHIEYVPLYKDGYIQPHSPERHEEVTRKEPSVTPTSPSASPIKRQRQVELEKDDGVNIAVAYICKAKAAQRNIILERCVDFGLKPGPLFGKLKNGETVVLENGTVITPDQVLSDVEPSIPILVIDCPSHDFLEALDTAPRIAALVEETRASPCLVIHMTPCSVVTSQPYQAWFKRFGSYAEHLFLNEWTSEVCHVGLYAIQTKLNLLHPRIFPLLPHQCSSLGSSSAVSVAGDSQAGRDASSGSGPNIKDTETVDNTDRAVDDQTLSDKNVTLGSTGLAYQYRPLRGFNRELCLKLDQAVFEAEALKPEGAAEALDRLRQNLAVQKELPYPEIVFLGTGSSIPSKDRNVSGILVHLNDKTSMLLDCGEGTAGQLLRHYGCRADDILIRLKAVFISHMHADHHLGLFNVLQERQKAFSRKKQDLVPVLLLAPVQISRWLEFYCNHVDDITSQLSLVSLQQLLREDLLGTDQSVAPVLHDLELSEFLPVEVEHCRTNRNTRKNAFGMALVNKHGWKLVYSGDTMPCNRLVTAGLGCDLLIHEATMEDKLVEEAKFKQHSTISQAIEIGHKMNSKFTMLTHFSQRYAKIPFLDRDLPDNVGIAFDNMTVRLSDLPLLPLFTDPLKVLFAEEFADLESRTRKRTLKEQLLEEIIQTKNEVPAEKWTKKVN